MAVVDHELAWLRLKAELGKKRSWGADQVLLQMNTLEVDCLIPEGERDFDKRPTRLPDFPPAVAALTERQSDDMATH